MFHGPLQTSVREKRKVKVKPYTFLGIPYYILLSSLIIIPLLLIIFYAVTIQEQGLYYKFTLIYFRQFFNETEFVKVMADSIVLAVMTTLICLFIGYPLAYFITKRKPITQAILVLLITAPMWVNMLIRTVAWKQIFDMINPRLLGTDFAIIVGMVYVFLPFMVLPIYTVLSKIDPLLYEASADLGGSNLKTFRKVTLPLSISGVLSGITMVLLPAATTMVIPRYLGQNRVLIGTLIERKFYDSGNWGYGAAIAIILSLIIMVMVLFTKKLDRNKEVERDEKA